MPKLNRNALSARMVRHAGPGSYVDGNGLMLRVRDSGSRSWVQRIMVHGRRVDIGLGNAELVSLADARRMAADNRAVARTGGDPRKAKTISFAVDARLEVEQAYRQHNDERIAHLHTLIVVVGKDGERLRQRLAESLTVSFRGGDWPQVPQAPERHVDESGKPLDRAAMARFVAAASIIGPIESVRDQLGMFVERTGAQRLVLYMEAIADATATRQSVISFAEHVDTPYEFTV